MDFEFVAGFGPIGADPDATHTFWAKTLGIPLEEDEPGYFHTFDLDGTKAFALWPLTQAAQATFGTPEWPANRPVPQAWIEFEVSSPDAVADTAARLRASGQELLQDAHEDPGGRQRRDCLVLRGCSSASPTCPAFIELPVSDAG